MMSTWHLAGLLRLPAGLLRLAVGVGPRYEWQPSTMQRHAQSPLPPGNLPGRLSRSVPGRVQVDGVKNPKVQSVYFQDMPVYHAAFCCGGNKVHLHHSHKGRENRRC